MAIYRNVHLKFWTDNKVTDDFTPEDKYFYLYLLTNPHTNLCGCWEYSLKQMSDETGYNKDTIERLIHRFESVHNVIKYSKDTKEILLLNWSKYNWTKSPKLEAAVKSEISKIKSKQFIEILEAELYGSNTVSDEDIYPSNTTDTDSITDTISESEKKKEIAKREHESVKNIVDYFNQKTGSKYRAESKKTQNCIKARLHEDFTEDDFYTVIDKKVTEWSGTNYAKYLRPETLFGNKFESYLNQKNSNGRKDFDPTAYLLGGCG